MSEVLCAKDIRVLYAGSELIWQNLLWMVHEISQNKDMWEHYRSNDHDTLLYGYNHVSRSSLVTFIKACQQPRGRQVRLPFHELMTTFGGKHCADSRDSIFALMAIASDSEKSLIDYSLSHKQLCMNVMQWRPLQDMKGIYHLTDVADALVSYDSSLDKSCAERICSTSREQIDKVLEARSQGDGPSISIPLDVNDSAPLDLWLSRTRRDIEKINVGLICAEKGHKHGVYPSNDLEVFTASNLWLLVHRKGKSERAQIIGIITPMYLALMQRPCWIVTQPGQTIKYTIQADALEDFLTWLYLVDRHHRLGKGLFDNNELDTMPFKRHKPSTIKWMLDLVFTGFGCVIAALLGIATICTIVYVTVTVTFLFMPIIIASVDRAHFILTRWYNGT